MYDETLVIEILSQIIEAINIIDYRFKPIQKVNDFTDSPAGMEKLDAICMPLQAVGESLKKIDKLTNNELLLKYPNINWKGAKAMRDIISHHYFEIDAEVIFDVCQNKILPLKNEVINIKNDLLK
jgi:uncharacterized protein with HEPN domain